MNFTWNSLFIGLFSRENNLCEIEGFSIKYNFTVVFLGYPVINHNSICYSEEVFRESLQVVGLFEETLLWACGAVELNNFRLPAIQAIFEINEWNFFFFFSCWILFLLEACGLGNRDLDVLGIGFIEFVRVAILAAQLSIYFEFEKLGYIIKLSFLFCFLFTD